MKEVFYEIDGEGVFSADSEFYSCLAKIADNKIDGWDEEMLVDSIIKGDYAGLAKLISKIGEMSYDEAWEKWFEVESESDINIEFSRNGKNYRVSSWSFDTYYYPKEKGVRQLREECRKKIHSSLVNDMAQAYNHDAADGWNLYFMAIRKNSNASATTAKSAPTAKSIDEPKTEIKNEPKTEIIRERVIEREKTGVLEGMLQQMVCELIANVSINDMMPRIKENIINEFGVEPQIHQVITIDGNKHQFQGITHKVFDEVLFFIANDIPVYLYGPAGSGKNVLTEQASEALGLDFYFMNSVTDEYKITGFIDAGGTYHETEFYKAFVNGGVFFLDEMDASAPEVLVCLNAAIANRYFAFPNGAVKAHPNFRVVAAGNTLGTGADAMYTGRMQLDAATLNRFETIPVDYDERIDLLSADNDEELVSFINGYRKAIKKCGIASVASYRNIKMIKAAEKAMTLEKAICYSLTKEMNTDDINTIIGSYSLPSNNRYTEALKSVKPLVA